MALSSDAPSLFEQRKTSLETEQRKLLSLKNNARPCVNGVFKRFEHPVLTAAHVPLNWRYDYDPESNPYFLERLGVNAVFNAGAILHEGRYLLIARVEGVDRKSFFAIAESKNGVNGFTFWKKPIDLPELHDTDATTNVYDARLTHHEDGWVYGIFCAERKDPRASAEDTRSAVASAGIMRTQDFITWERLPDLKTPSPQQRNVALHPRYVDGKYLLYTRPQDAFVEAGSGGGIAWGLTDKMTDASIDKEFLLDPRRYHTIKEAKNGAGAPPLETKEGWLHVAHGVRNTAAGLRYVLYAFLCDLQEPGKLLYAPGGYLIAPEGGERTGDVSNVVFSNGIIHEPSGRILIYYASSDTRLHVAETNEEILLDYVKNTPPDALTSHACVKQRLALIEKNTSLI